MELTAALPARVPAEVKELVLKTVDDAVADGVHPPVGALVVAGVR